MDLVIIVLGILYLIGFKVGTALAISLAIYSIIKNYLITLVAILKKFRKMIN